MNLETLRSLQARIRNATGPDRGLDRAIADALLGKSHPINRRTLPPTYTGSLDACVALLEGVLPSAEFSISTLYGIIDVELPLNSSGHAPSTARRLDAEICLTFLECVVSAVIAREEAKETETMP